jgi:MoaA/NifB/PqqE/SkfB family radical SAM enzyme
VKFNPTRFISMDKNGTPKFPTIIDASFYESASLVAQKVIHDNRNHPSIHLLDRVYIEPTNRCNLDCLTCIRNVWDEPLGMMEWETYERILGGVQAFSPIPTVFLGGFGELLIHLNLIKMIQGVKEIGGSVELITNGILLTQELSIQLIESGLDVLWISIDGVTPESYADVRLGATLPTVLDNLDILLHEKFVANKTNPRIGIASVAMKRNAHELPEIIQMGTAKGIEYLSITNVLAYTPELREEVMYERTLIDRSWQARDTEEINNPRMDLSNQTIEAYRKALQSHYRFQLTGSEVDPSIAQCPFLLMGSTSIRWDGELSPCLPLLHTHDSYLGKRFRRSYAYTIGNIRDFSLMELWENLEYVSLRQRLQAFDFSPCTYCNSCEMADSNLEDCFGNIAPACGGCLWAQGLIRCP